VRILHISTRLILGGSQENTVLSCEGQARLGHDVHLAYGPIFGPEGSMLERVRGFRTGDGRGIQTHEVASLVREVNPIKDWRCVRELGELIRRLKPDVVHTHSSKAGILGRAAGMAAYRASLRERGINDAAKKKGDWKDVHGATLPRPAVIHTIHGPPFMPLAGSPLLRLRRMLTNRAYIAAERQAARRCHAIVSVADAMTELFLSKGIGRREQYVTVYSGMETERFLNAAQGEDRDSMRRLLGFSDLDIVIGTVARLAEHKGHDDLLDALGAELKVRPNLKLLWVGDGWWRERLIDKARGMGLVVAELDDCARRSFPSATLLPPNPLPQGGGAQILLTGLVPTERVAAHMRAMDILAHPSYREGLPRTVPQALLCGVVPVAYDVDGTREACVEGKTGRLVRVGDREGLRKAVMGLVDSPGERKRLAEAGREMCRVRFSAETMVRELEGVYQRALELAGAKSRSPSG